MKFVLLPALAVFTLTMTSIASASTYDCELTGSNSIDKEPVKYSLDTQTEQNKFVNLQNGVSVGCVVLRVTPELLTCGLMQEQKFSMFATVENHTSILAIDSSGSGGKSSLRCKRRE